MRFLFVGDLVGVPGRQIFQRLVPELRREFRADFVIANCENVAGGFGATPELCRELWDAGADCLTSGNHIWKKREIYSYIDQESRLLRPANFPEGTPGRGYSYFVVRDREVVIVNLMGRAFMEPLCCPFRQFDRIYDEVAGRTPVIFVDFHAETTSEKTAFGWYADGRASAVVGTHTHVQTADERILKQGTAYLTDAGMTGPTEGILGVAREPVIERFLTQMPVRFEVAAGPSRLMGVVVEVDATTGRARSIERLQRPGDEDKR
jgi:2',3'-cyclic-nucleotide 2'-phosphodiesterase